MNYKLINEYSLYTPVLEQSLENRGITDISYLTLDKSSLHSPYLLKDIEKAADLIIKHCQANNRILIVVDSDCDGYTSAAALYNYLILAFPNIEDKIDYILHPTKAHGIIINDDILKTYQLICVPDAGSNDVKEHEILLKNGIDLVVLDHHEVDCEPNVNEHFALVNNQYSADYPNKMISGVGVVWKTLTVLDEKLNVKYADLFLDLVAVGMAADMQSLLSSETAYLIREGLKSHNLRNPYITTLIKASSYTIKEVKDMNYITVSFSIAPFINAVTRVGTMDEKLLLFNSMLTNKAYNVVPSTKRGHKAGDTEILVQQAFRVCTNIKNRQKKLKEEGATYIKSIMEDYDLENEKSIILNINNKLERSLVGLVANEITSEYQRPVLLLSENEEELVGSGRNYDRSEINNLKGALNEINEVNWAKGHPSAFGVSVKKEKIEELRESMNEKFKNVNLTPKYDIDYIFTQRDNADWIVQQIMTVGEMNYLWGKGCEEPLILFKDYEISINDIQLLARGTLKINLGNGISAIKFFTKETEYEDMISSGENKIINLIGHCSINKWNGNKYPQIMIVDYEIENSKKKWVF